MTQTRRKIEFPNDSGQILSGMLELPVATPRAYALFAHCFTCSKDAAAASRISRALAAKGLAVLRFDFTGLGNSDGDFANTNFSSNVADLVAAARYLEAHHQAPTILVGHSLGGAAVLIAAGQIDACRAVVTIGAPSDPDHVRRHLAAHEQDIRQDGLAQVSLAGRQFTIKKQFLDDIAQQNAASAVANLKAALLIFHAPGDTVVGIDEAARIYGMAKHPKSFVSLDDADHLLSRRRDSEYVGAVIAAWVDRYLPPEPEEVTPEAEAGTVVVSEQGVHYRQHIATAHHNWYADEPESLGGGDTGPTPYDLLLSGLGACTTITLRMYAQHKKWPLDHIAVTLRHARIHAKDCQDCETQTGQVDVIERRLHLRGDLTLEQRQKLLEISDKCPVHRTLHGEIKVRTDLA